MRHTLVSLIVQNIKRSRIISAHLCYDGSTQLTSFLVGKCVSIQAHVQLKKNTNAIYFYREFTRKIYPFIKCVEIICNRMFSGCIRLLLYIYTFFFFSMILQSIKYIKYHISLQQQSKLLQLKSSYTVGNKHHIQRRKLYIIHFMMQN